MSNSTQISSAVLALFYNRTDGRTKQSSLAFCMDSNAPKCKLSPSFDTTILKDNDLDQSGYQVHTQTRGMPACMRAHRRPTAFVRQYNSSYFTLSVCSYVEHRAFKKLFHLVLTKASTFASFQLFPAFCSAHCIVLFQAVLGLPLFLVP
jgi:hypothetical protein